MAFPLFFTSNYPAWRERDAETAHLAASDPPLRCSYMDPPVAQRESFWVEVDAVIYPTFVGDASPGPNGIRALPAYHLRDLAIGGPMST